jgi:hypothetical protein
MTNTLALGTSVLTIHGSASSDAYTYIDGMRSGAHMTATGNTGGGPNLMDAATEEITFDTGSQGAESQVGGVRMNMIPKEGGNRFAGTLFAYGAGAGVQSDNRTPELKAVIRDANRLAYTFEAEPAFGGPILQDRLWFYSAFFVTRSKTYVADTYFADGRQAFTIPKTNHQELLRLTSQLTQRNKIGLAFQKNTQGSKNNGIGPNTSQEATILLPLPLTYLAHLKWTSPVTNRLLVEAGASVNRVDFRHDYQPEVGPLDVANVELTTGRTTVASSSRLTYTDTRYEAVGSLSYVTGSHTFKTGFGMLSGSQQWTRPFNGHLQSLRFFSGQPNAVVVTSAPANNQEDLNADLGVYAQDRWVVKRLTVNVGARYDHFNAGTPEQSAPAGNFVPARHFAPIHDLPKWNDWAVRLGFAYDLFGTGRTALKAHVNKYVAGMSMGLTQPYNPMNLQTEQRSWNDLNGDRTVLNPDGTVQYREIGPTRNANFGLDAGTTRLDPNLPRGYNWEQGFSVQHELRPGLGITAGYYRRQFYNIPWTDNLLVDPDRDYTPFTITAPADPRLPGGGGEVISLHNLNPSKLGVVDNLVTASRSNRELYNGFEVTGNVRLPRGGYLFGGVTTQRLAIDSCEVDNPNARRFCSTVPPFRTLLKVSGMYPLPYAVQISGSFQAKPGLNSSGRSIGATYNVTSAIAGVPLTGGGSIAVQLIEPETLYPDYQNQLDLRVTRTFRFGRVQARPLVDIYNVLNVGTIVQVNETWGPLYGRPQLIMQARYVRFGAQIDF